MERARERHRRDETGAVAIMMSLVAVLLFVVAAMVVDLGLARDTKRQSQDSADASALAAANALYPDSNQCSTPVGAAPPCFDDAITAAQSYASVNFGVDDDAWASCTDPGALANRAAATPCISFDATSSQVRVVVPTRDVKTGLGTLAGVTNIPISTRAQAGVTPGLPGTAACGLCVLEDASMSGNPGVQVLNSNIHLNRSSFSGNPTLATTGQFVTYAVPATSGHPTLPPRVAGPPPPDPLSHLALPFTAAANALPSHGDVSRSGNGTCTLLPGRYGSLSLSGSVSCTMSPGLYSFTGSVSLSGSSRLDATSGVTFYFTCGSATNVRECGASSPWGETGGSLNLSGTNDIDIVAPQVGAAWDGLAVVYDRKNTSNLNYSGTNQKTLRGSVYARSATMNLSGTADSAGLDALIVVKNLNVSGNGTIKLAYTAPNNPTMPELPGEVALTQ